ncbi:hypothetical protein GCM10009838_80210 [Catenulispora subtropica]|uniref:Uncharacterized protein n=1 Tax=Catenulispora subtropica TaxID=450798 RepID=A0ABN2T940_9ACTN
MLGSVFLPELEPEQAVLTASVPATARTRADRERCPDMGMGVPFEGAVMVGIRGAEYLRARAVGRRPQAAVGGQRSEGARASRTESPSRLKATTKTRIARPGTSM